MESDLRKDGGTKTEKKDWTKIGQFLFFCFWCGVIGVLIKVMIMIVKSFSN